MPTSTSTTRINAVTEFEKCAKKIFDVVVVVVVLVVVVEARSLSLSFTSSLFLMNVSGKLELVPKL